MEAAKKQTLLRSSRKFCYAIRHLYEGILTMATDFSIWPVLGPLISFIGGLGVLTGVRISKKASNDRVDKVEQATNARVDKAEEGFRDSMTAHDRRDDERFAQIGQAIRDGLANNRQEVLAQLHETNEYLRTIIRQERS